MQMQKSGWTRSWSRWGVVATASAGLLLASVGSALASGDHNDALIFEDGGKVQIGAVDVDCLTGVGAPGCTPTTLERVYEAELLESATTPIFGAADEPGFFSLPTGEEAALPYGNLLPPNAGHSVDFIRAPNSPVADASILFWDGTGPVSWSAVPNLEFFEMDGENGFNGILSGFSVLTGVELAPTSANSFFDTHPDFFLRGDGVDPTLGFYAIFGRTNIEGLESSDAWSIVFDFGIEDEALHELAIENVASFIPEPTTALLLGIGLTGLGLQGRRRRSA